MIASWQESYDKPRQHIKKQKHHFADKGPYSQGYGLSSSHIWMWELEHKEAEYQRTDGFELWSWRKTIESPLDCKEIKPASPKENQPWILFAQMSNSNKAKPPYGSLLAWRCTQVKINLNKTWLRHQEIHWGPSWKTKWKKVEGSHLCHKQILYKSSRDCIDGHKEILSRVLYN